MPLLQRPLINPHATLITLFINAVLEAQIGFQQEVPPPTDMPTLHRVFGYLPLLETPLGQYDPKIIKLKLAETSFASLTTSLTCKQPSKTPVPSFSN